MRPYLGPNIRINKMAISVAGDITYNSKHIEQMESLAYLWRDGEIFIWNVENAEDFQLILNSPTILQCRYLIMNNAHFTFKDYKILYTIKVIETRYYSEDETDC